eukprot:263664-Amorphochlora_amoeboformis.AAC.2
MQSFEPHTGEQLHGSNQQIPQSITAVIAKQLPVLTEGEMVQQCLDLRSAVLYVGRQLLMWRLGYGSGSGGRGGQPHGRRGGIGELLSKVWVIGREIESPLGRVDGDDGHRGNYWQSLRIEARQHARIDSSGMWMFHLFLSMGECVGFGRALEERRTAKEMATRAGLGAH